MDVYPIARTSFREVVGAKPLSLSEMLGLITTVATVIVGGLVAFIATRLQSKTDVRREQRLEFLINAYRQIGDCAHRPLDGDQARAFERALADVDLFGEHEHIELAAAVRAEFAEDGSASLDRLLNALRRDLRHELGLPADQRPGVPTIRIETARQPQGPGHEGDALSPTNRARD